MGWKIQSPDKTQNGMENPIPRKTQNGMENPIPRETQNGMENPIPRKTQNGMESPIPRKTMIRTHDKFEQDIFKWKSSIDLKRLPQSAVEVVVLSETWADEANCDVQRMIGSAETS